MITTADIQPAFSRAFHMIASGSIFLWCILIFDHDIQRLLSDQPLDVALEVKSLSFEDGLFHQKVSPNTDIIVQARWSASISLNNFHICSGGGYAPYSKSGAPLVMTPDHWTDGDCGDLQEGLTYDAEASWEWSNYDNTRRRISHRFEFTP